jgi:hypothetical protein
VLSSVKIKPSSNGQNISNESSGKPHISKYRKDDKRVRVTVFNTTFNNISVISWQKLEYQEKATDIYHIISTPHLSRIRTHVSGGSH